MMAQHKAKLNFRDLDTITLEAIRTGLQRLEVLYMELAGIYEDVGTYADYRTHKPSTRTIEQAKQVAEYILETRQISEQQRAKINKVLAARAEEECKGGPVDDRARSLGFEKQNS